MDCNGTPIAELAQTIKAHQDGLGDRNPEIDVYRIHIYLQAQDAVAGGGHPHYTVHADRSYGGTEEALELVHGILPDGVYHLLYNEEQYDDAYEAFDDAMLDEI